MTSSPNGFTILLALAAAAAVWWAADLVWWWYVRRQVARAVPGWSTVRLARSGMPARAGRQGGDRP